MCRAAFKNSRQIDGFKEVLFSRYWPEELLDERTLVKCLFCGLACELWYGSDARRRFIKVARPLYQTLLMPPARMPSIKGFKLDEAIILRQMRRMKAEQQK